MMLRASNIVLGLCSDPKCRCVHLDLLDENDRMIAAAVIGIEQVPEVIKNMQNLAYMITTGEKPRGQG